MKNYNSLLRFLAVAAIGALSITATAKPKYITYEKYGAKGDGFNNDFPAIVRAHEVANEKGLPVKAKDGATYYIGGEAATAIIKTDTDFGTASFIIDDRAVENLGKSVFSIEPNEEMFKLRGVKTLSAGQKNIGVKLPGRCLLVPHDSSKKLYIRYGLNQNGGQPQKEVLIVDADGNVEEKTAIMWDYSRVSSIEAYPIPETTLTVKGGTFTTIANQDKNEANYYARNIKIKRSNVRVEGMTHLIEGEQDHGGPYNGWLVIGTCADVTISSCVFTGHRFYYVVKPTGRVAKGTYDISVNTAANIRFENCSQTDDIDNSKHWGVMGTNYAKNLQLHGCSFSRFDAHQGVENVTLTDCTFGHMGVRMVGAGTIYMENCLLKFETVVALRQDYGSTWDGDIIIKNCTLRPYGKKNRVIIILQGKNNGKHDFGYPCRIPRSITVDGLVIDDSDFVKYPEYEGPYIFSDYGYDVTNSSLIPIPTDCRVSLKNVSVASGREIKLSPAPEFYKDVTFPTD